MRFIKNIFLGETVKAEYHKIRSRLNHGAGTVGIYVICMPETSDDPLEYFDAALLRQHYYRKNPPVIIGIAKGTDEAIAIVEQIIKQCMEETGSIDVRSYVEGILNKDGDRK